MSAITSFRVRDISYLFNFKNHDTHYTSGNELALDYGLSYAATDAWQMGISGFAYKQMTDDKLNGRVVGDGNKRQTVGLGPFIRYHPSPDWGITFKWQYEALVENRAQGYRFLLQMMHKLR